ncbi:DUF1764-domain-containing protein [Fomitiporia mediterranea MF3/22]|uniref:DUF1764-domain-containing protein n=1 Tax=Fomitiporia mediterranea (strain MF3/22) TaxID=694068 RepID=UPI0004409148|nr:DUF1764-domain-containing protein [Fomitiporia mediterranea MF3/22]EJD07218.1 DUF1764-domain-containing protein [Fomitiporia mediterranea MF3/22]
MPTTEIDDIFSGKLPKLADSTSKTKGKEKEKAKEERTDIDVSTGSAKKKAKKRKRELERNGLDAVDTLDTATASTKSTMKSNSRDKEDGTGAVEEKKKPKRSRIVETVQDPSTTLPSTTIPPPTSTKPSKLKEKLRSKNKPLEEEKKMDEVLERFKDSRGTGPRKRTEEGFLVYKEDELGIRDAGGHTSLCPFDCDCCF